MYFIGQGHIMPALGDILSESYHTKAGVSILFRGASGYGKTELAKKCCNFLVGTNYEICLGKEVSFNPNIWVHFIDEIHLMAEPEVLYPIIDTGKYVFVFATNFDSILPEALVNRCNSFIFSEYSEEELIDIFRQHCKLPFGEETIKYIIKISGKNPRVMVKTYIFGLSIRYKNRSEELQNKPDKEIIEEINQLYGIEEGLDRISRQYLDCLKHLGGRSSLDNLVATVKLDKDTIKYVIEPPLLYNGFIKITSKGRELCQLK